MIRTQAEIYESGRAAGAGSFVCLGCGYRVVLEALDEIPECPSCAGARFRRASLFEPPVGGPVEQPTADHPPLIPEAEHPGWLERARVEISERSERGQFVAFRDREEVHVLALEEGWSRIGRSISADIRLDDPTVSRRHALIVKTPDGRMRVLDDRSLNGVFVNGERVEWSRLEDGAEIAVGRYRLHLIDTASVRAGAEVTAE